MERRGDQEASLYLSESRADEIDRIITMMRTSFNQFAIMQHGDD
jgi:hypothetical protein